MKETGPENKLQVKLWRGEKTRRWTEFQLINEMFGRVGVAPEELGVAPEEAM